MHALAARRLGEADETEVGQSCADLVGSAPDIGEAEPLAGVEIEDDAVGPVGAVDARVPRMNSRTPICTSATRPLASRM